MSTRILRRVLLILGAGLAIALVLFAPLFQNAVQDPKPSPVQLAPTLATNEFLLKIESPKGDREFTMPCVSSADCGTALSALINLAAQDTITVQTKAYDGLGTMVTAISGVENGEFGRYWVFEINDQNVPVAADAYKIQAGDRLTWKFVISD